MRNKWQKLEYCRKLLGLPSQVTIREIKDAYRKKSRLVHPDLNEEARKEEMSRLNDAYRTLMNYCENYKIKLTLNEDGMTDEEWWFFHFGQDPVWGKDRE